MRINPALADLRLLVGQWRMELYNAAFLPAPDARTTGAVEIDWIEEGSALRMRQGHAADPPAAVWIIGRDERESEYSVLYADDRGVSRVYRMSFKDDHWEMWRNTPDFTQRFHAEVDLDATMIRGRWEKSTDQGATWEHDFNIDYMREPASDNADS